MQSVIGIYKKIIGGQKDGTFYNAEGKFSAIVVIEEDQSYEKKSGEKVVKLVQIPFKFWGEYGEKANDEKYLGQMVKVEYTLGGYNPEGDKWYPNLNGCFLHRWEGEVLKNTKPSDDIPF